MFLEKLLNMGKKERDVINDIKSHIELLCAAFESFKTAMENSNGKMMRNITVLEREGDDIRRHIISHIYDGAFLPYIRPDLCKFVEIVDTIFDTLEDMALLYLDMKLPDQVKGECIRIAFLNFRMCEMLLITFKTMINGEDLREKTLAIRIYEKKIDDMKFGLIKEIQKVPIKSFWEGNILFSFISSLTTLSDIIEDASDHLQIIHLSMK